MVCAIGTRCVSRPSRAIITRVATSIPRSVSAFSPSARRMVFSSGCATMPAPRPESGSDTRSYTSACQPWRSSESAASSPLIEPPITSARFTFAKRIPPQAETCYSLAHIP